MTNVAPFPTRGMGSVERLDWLAAVGAHTAVTAAGLKVAIALAWHHNAETGRLNPSAGTIAKETGLTVRAVRQGVSQLEHAGLLDVQRSAGGSHSSTSSYRLLPRPMNDDSRVNNRSRVNDGSATGEPSFTPGVNGASPKQGIEQGKNREGSRKRDQRKHPAFAEWYQAYPKKVARGQAEKAFARIDPSPELVATMIAALERQIAERGRRKAKGEFMPDWKHPATWLNGKCWLDELRADEAQPIRYATEDF